MLHNKELRDLFQTRSIVRTVGWAVCVVMVRTKWVNSSGVEASWKIEKVRR
jgi:hypothetical protein